MVLSRAVFVLQYKGNAPVGSVSLGCLVSVSCVSHAGGFCSGKCALNVCVTHLLITLTVLTNKQL